MMKISHSNYLSFAKPEDEATVLSSFIKEFTETDSWSKMPFAKNIIDSYNGNSLKLKSSSKCRLQSSIVYYYGDRI